MVATYPWERGYDAMRERWDEISLGVFLFLVQRGLRVAAGRSLGVFMCLCAEGIEGVGQTW